MENIDSLEFQSEWFPAIVKPENLIRKSHMECRHIDGGIACKSGERIRVRENVHARGSGRCYVEIHPEDVERLWPHLKGIGEGVACCRHSLFMD